MGGATYRKTWTHCVLFDHNFIANKYFALLFNYFYIFNGTNSSLLYFHKQVWKYVYYGILNNINLK